MSTPSPDSFADRSTARRPTMRDVAEAAGVSLKTVSRVVNGEAGVTPALQEQVRSAVHSLDYRPDHRARSLRRRSTGSRTIGFVQTDVANPFFSAVFRGMEDEASTRGFLVVAGSSDADADREEALVRSFVERRVDGLVMASATPDLSYLASELKHGTPVVFVDLEPAAVLGDVVRSDHFGGAAIATRHLVAHGHRRIAFLGDRPSLFSARERRRAFVEVMAEQGLPTPWILSDLTTPGDAEAATDRMLGEQDRPTALFTAQNYVTTGAVRALRRWGLHQRVAVVGFDDPDFAELVDPMLTVVPQDPVSLGRIAASHLFDRLAGAEAKPRRTVVPLDLVQRGSGEIRPT
ncbi:MAG: LacI family DNA-binding transcriptional regulator [Actinomycetota bacterium]